MIRFILFLALSIGTIPFASAQISYHPANRPTNAEREFDKNVRSCVKPEFPTVTDENFSFADWISTVNFYTGLMVQRVTSGFTDKIAEQRTRAMEIGKLAQTCEALKAAKSELADISKIYEKNVKTGEEENSDGKAKIDMKSAKELVSLSKKVAEKLKITRKIVRIQ